MRDVLQSVSTRRVHRRVQQFGVEHLSKDQGSRLVRQLDETSARWREHPLGAYLYLSLDAHDGTVRMHGVARTAAVLIAMRAGLDGHRRILGLSVAVSETEMHWREFSQHLVARRLHGAWFLVTDQHPGLGNARNAVLPAAVRQRCPSLLRRNAQTYAPTVAIRYRFDGDLRAVWDADDLPVAEATLAALADGYPQPASRLAERLEENVPDRLAALTLPRTHRRQLRTTHPIERLNQEVRRRARLVHIFPNETSAEWLVTGVFIEIDEEWETSHFPYIRWGRPEETKCAAQSYLGTLCNLLLLKGLHS